MKCDFTVEMFQVFRIRFLYREVLNVVNDFRIVGVLLIYRTLDKENKKPYCKVGRITILEINNFSRMEICWLLIIYKVILNVSIFLFKWQE